MAETRARRWWIGGAIAALLALAAAWLLLGGRDAANPADAPEIAAESADAVHTASPSRAPRPGTAPGGAGSAPETGGADGGASAEAPAALAIVAPWGDGLHQLGRSRPEEGNPEAPMSFAVGPDGRPFVLDQVNGRIVRYGPDGQPIDSLPVTQQAPQDLAVAGDGTTLVLDRLADRSVAVLGPDGRLRGDLPVVGKGIEEGGEVTGVFVDGKDVYVEREHGDLVRIGDTEGRVDADRPEIPGRPSRDGKSFLLAGIVDPAAGRLFVTAIDRETQQHRFTRELRVGTPAVALVLLDSDLSGVIYVAAVIEMAGARGEPEPALKLLCLAPTDGQPVGSADLPVNHSPEETFRDLVVLDGGGVVYAQRSETGVAYQRYECR